MKKSLKRKNFPHNPNIAAASAACVAPKWNKRLLSAFFSLALLVSGFVGVFMASANSAENIVTASTVMSGVKALGDRTLTDINEKYANVVANPVYTDTLNKLRDGDTALHVDIGGSGDTSLAGIKLDFGAYYDISEVTVWTLHIAGGYLVNEITAFASIDEGDLYTESSLLGIKRLETTPDAGDAAPITITLTEPRLAQYVTVFFSDWTSTGIRITEIEVMGTLSETQPDPNIMLPDNNLAGIQMLPSPVVATDSTFTVIQEATHQFGTGDYSALTDGVPNVHIDLYGGIPEDSAYIRGMAYDLKGFYEISKLGVNVWDGQQDIMVKDVWVYAALEEEDLYKPESLVWSSLNSMDGLRTKSISPVKKVRYVTFFFHAPGSYPRVREVEVYGKAADDQPPPPPTNILRDPGVTVHPRFDPAGKFNTPFSIPSYPENDEDPDSPHLPTFASVIKGISLDGFTDGNTTSLVQIYGGMPDNEAQKGRPIVLYDLGKYYDITGVRAYVDTAITSVRIYASGYEERISYHGNLVYADTDNTNKIREAEFAPKKVRYVAFCLAKSDSGWRAAEFEVYGTVSEDQTTPPVEDTDPKYPSGGGVEVDPETAGILFQMLPYKEGMESNGELYTFGNVGGSGPPDHVPWREGLTDGIIQDEEGFYQFNQFYGGDPEVRKKGARYTLIYDLGAYYELDSVGVCATPAPGTQMLTGWTAYAGNDDTTIFNDENEIANSSVVPGEPHVIKEVTKKEAVRYIGFVFTQNDTEYGVVRITEVQAFGEKVGELPPPPEPPEGGYLTFENSQYGVTAWLFLLDDEDYLELDGNLVVTKLDDQSILEVAYNGLDKRYIPEEAYSVELTDENGDTFELDGRRVQLFWTIPDSLASKSVRLACVDMDNGTADLLNTTEVDGRLAFETYVFTPYVFVSRDDAYTGGDNDPSPNTSDYLFGIVVALALLSSVLLLLFFSRRNPKLARALFGSKKKKMLNMLSIILVFALSMSGVFLFLTIPASASMDGSGTAEDPYKIYTAEDLAQLAMDVQAGNTYAGEYFELKADIDLTDYLSEDEDGWNGGAGWLPIGTSTAGDNAFPNNANIKPFSGIFKGMGHTISGLWINRQTENGVGLFGVIKDAVITDLHLVIDNENSANAGSGNEGVTNTARIGVNGTANVGGLVGCAISTNAGDTRIEKCSVTAVNSEKTAVSSVGHRQSNYSYTGGLIGGNGESNQKGGYISNSHATVNVFSKLHMAGGFVGFCGTDGKITACYATGRVYTQNAMAGGFAGRLGDHRCVVENCYSTGDVGQGGNANASGGFAGTIQFSYSSVIVSNCYSTGQVSAPSATRAKGFIGHNFAGDVVPANCGVFNSYFLQDVGINEGLDGLFDTSAISTDEGAMLEVTPLTISQFQSADTFSGWDSQIWYLADGSYPALYVDIIVRPKLGQGKEYDGMPIDPASIELEVFGAPPGFTLNGIPEILNNGSAKGEYIIAQGTITSDSNPGYRITFEQGVYVITGIQILITPTPGQSMVYTGSAPDSIHYTVSPDTVALTGSLGLENNAVDAGTHRITLGTLAVDGPDADNYTFILAEETFEITKATVTVTPDAGQSMTYNGTTPTDITYKSEPEGLSFTGSLALEGNPVDAGTYVIVQGTLALSGSDAHNYELSFTSGVTYQITRAVVTVTPNPDQSKVYDGTTAQNITYSTSPEGVAMTGALALENDAYTPGVYNIVQGTLEVVDTTNYEINFISGVKYTIAHQVVTVTPKAGQSKTYDGMTAENIQFDSDIPGVTFTGALALENDAKDAGSHNIVRGTLEAEGFYVINMVGNVKYTINPAPLTVTPVSGQSKEYDKTPVTSGIEYTVDGLKGSDTLSGALALENDAVTAGEHKIVAGTLSNPNYIITVTPVSFTITPKAITVTPVPGQTKVYDKTAPEIAYEAEGLLDGDTLSGALALENDAVDAGTYQIVIGTLSNPNYSISVAEESFTITPRSLTVTPKAGQSKTFDGKTASVIEYDVSGILEGDTLSGALALENEASSVGSHRIVLGTLSNPNYNISVDEAYFTIEAAPNASESNTSSKGSQDGQSDDEENVKTGGVFPTVALVALMFAFAGAVVFIKRRQKDLGV